MPMFQSSPNPQTGCDGRCRAPRGHVGGFNPHPILRLGATTARTPPISLSASFQSSPNPQTGCDNSRAGNICRSTVFQSSPNPQTGCDGMWLTDNSSILGFNPHPILRLGATLRVRRPHPAAGRRFNPHPILRLGATLLDARHVSHAQRFNPHPILRLGATPHQFLMMWTGKRGSFARTPPAASQ